MHCILWLNLGSGTHQNTYSLTIYTVCSIEDWVNLSTPERLAPLRMRKPLRWVVLVITLQHLGMKAIATRHWLRKLVKTLRIQKNEVKIHFSNWLGGNGFMVVLYPVYTCLYRLCRVYRFFVFPKVSIACPESFGNVWLPCRASRCMDLHPRKIQLLGLIILCYFGLISLCE